MIAVDTSSFIAYLSGEEGSDVEAVDRALEQKQVVFPPMVLAELLSDPKLSKETQELFKEVPLLSLSHGYWERAGLLRAKLIAKGRKALLADTLIAQVCLDHKVPLISRDQDFRHFVKHAGLNLTHSFNTFEKWNNPKD